MEYLDKKVDCMWIQMGIPDPFTKRSAYDEDELEKAVPYTDYNPILGILRNEINCYGAI